MSAKTIVRKLGPALAGILAGTTILIGGSPASVAAPTEVKASAKAVAQPDFNGDGRADLAVINLFDKGGEVNILYGSSSGLRAAGAQRWSPTNVPSLAAIDVYSFGKALAPGDFNHDGYADLAVGLEKLEPGADEVSGAIVVLFGSAQGLTATNSQYVTHKMLTGPPHSTYDDRFGWVLAAADFGRGSYTDLAISSTAEGVVHVVYGSAKGLSLTDGQIWSRATPGIKGSAEGDLHFGDAMAAANFNGSGPADLAIGAPMAKVGKVFGAGAVNIIMGSANGLTATGDQLWTRDSPGIKGEPAYYDGFGTLLVSGHFAGRKSADLAISTVIKMSVSVIYGSSKGLTATGDQLWDKKSKGLPKNTFQGEFPRELTAANFGQDPAGKTRDDLAICLPGSAGTGTALVLYGASKGLSASKSDQWTQDTPGIPEVPGDGEGFCSSMDAGAFDGGRYAALAIRSQKVFDEDDGEVHVAAPGTIHVLPGAKAGLTVAGLQLWTVDNDGVHPG